MKFMILVKSNPDLEARLAAMSDSQMKEQMAAMGVFNEELKKAGVMKDCDGLRPSREGKRVRFDGNTRTVVDGPFAGDLVAGYWLGICHPSKRRLRGSSAAQTRCPYHRRSRSGRSSSREPAP